MSESKLGSFIYQLRKREGLSQTEFADKLGVTNKAISKWETGNAKPAVTTLRRLSILFDIPIEKLLILKHETDAEELLDE